MSTPAVAPLSQHNVVIISENQHSEFDARLHETIAQRAYEIFEKDGRLDGHQDAHWQQAECELLQRVTEVREAARG